jgi:hypothetical protein
VSAGDSDDRRRYRRVRAHILVRPVGLLSRKSAREVSDISPGGIRTLSDELLPRGRRLEIELLFEDSGTATLLVEVAWLAALPPGGPARYEVGLKIVDGHEGSLARLAAALGSDPGQGA